MGNHYLITGLGNPGRRYANTRHNAGFMLVDLLAERWKLTWSSDSRTKSEIATRNVEGCKVTLCKPQTFMNASGECVGPLLRWHKLEADALLVAIDDADLELGTLRMRAEGSSGGHHGLENIERHIGTKKFARQKIGIGRRQAGVREISGHVLGKFSEQELPLIILVLERAADQAECWIQHEAIEAMNRFNGSIDN